MVGHASQNTQELESTKPQSHNNHSQTILHKTTKPNATSVKPRSTSVSCNSYNRTGKHSTKANTAKGKGTSMQVKELNYQLMVLAPRMNLMFTKASH